MEAIDLETVIKFVTGPRGESLVEIYKRLGIGKGEFLSKRRSPNKYRKNDLAKRIIGAILQNLGIKPPVK